MKNKNPGNTIYDFGTQWTEYTENTGYYASVEVLDDLFGPLMEKGDIKGKTVADVGAGTGRFVRMFHQLGARRILALEPSEAVNVLRANTEGLTDVEYLQATAENLPSEAFDFVFCIGVLQFIPDPLPALKAMGRALGPGGRLFLWVYGKENNSIYLALVKPLRLITSRLPHKALAALSGALVVPADAYAFLCRRLKLPLSDYMRRYFSRLDRYSRKLVIYDQLNPGVARYYSRDELKGLLEESGFSDIRMHHRLGYSWSVLARFKGD